MKTLIVLSAILLGAQTLYLDSHEVKDQWESFKLTHGKQYSSEIEENFRMKVFTDRLNMIETHNQKYYEGLVSYYLGMNQFGDLFNHEITSRSCYNDSMDLEFTKEVYFDPDSVELSDSMDWRDRGAVTPVKDQGHCASCYTFSTTGSLEGQHFIKTGNLVSLSEQNLIDCSTSQGNNGCNKGQMTSCFRYIQENGGIDTEDSYPYQGADGTCQYNSNTIGATVTGFVNVQPGSEEQLQAAVGTVGPISVAIDDTQPSFTFYKGGVYDDPNCSNTVLSHAVLVVGYDTTSDGTQYWTVKNSWGPGWGEAGYFRLARNNNNRCGVANQASYPTV